MLPDYSSEDLITKGYGSNIYAYRAINAIASNISAMPFRVGLGGRDVNHPRATAPLARLLGPPPGTPNPQWSPGMLWRYSICQYLITGVFAWIVEKNPHTGQIQGLWPMSVQHIRPIFPDPDSTKPEYFEGYEYGVPGGPEYRTFKPDEIVYCWRPSLKDPRKPESPLDIASLDLNIYTLLGQFDLAFLQNGGVPSHMIVTAPFTDDVERQAFRAQFTSKFGGAPNTGKPMFGERSIEPGEEGGSDDPISIVQIGQSQKDAELSTLRDTKIADTCVALGVPLSILGDSRTAKFENVEADRRTFWMETCKPVFREVEDLVNTHLAPRMGGDTGWFDTDGIPELRSVPAISDENAIQLIAAEAITLAEWREMRSLGAMDYEQLDKERAARMDAAPVAQPPARPQLRPPTAVEQAKPPAKQLTPPRVLKTPISATAQRLDRAEPDNTPALALLKVLLDDMAETRAQQATSRRKRPFNVTYWIDRTRALMEPVTSVENPRAVVSAFVADATLAPDEALTLLRTPAAQVSASLVADQLFQVATGQLDADRALRLIQGGAA